MKSTLDYYDDNAQDYHARVHGSEMGALHRLFLSRFSGRIVLDLGCGTGRDARFFTDQGLRVIAVDGSREMIGLTASACPSCDCRLVDFREDFTIGEPLDGVWACASLLHLDEAGFERAVRNVLRDLRVGGVFYMSLKEADHELPPDDSRFFHYWTVEELRAVTGRLGLEPIELTVESTPRATWINAFFRKA